MTAIRMKNKDGRGWVVNRLVFSIYSRGEKLNRIRCRRIRVSIFHKIGEGRNTGKLRFKKNTRGSIFSTVTRYFSKTLCGSISLPGRKKLRYAHARNPADRVSFREFVNSALQIGMESRILNVSSVRSLQYSSTNKRIYPSTY